MANPTNDATNWMGGSDVPLTGFSWKSGGTRDTTGIILWSDVFLSTNKIGEKLAIVLMDTQGLFDSKTSPADNSRIFALGTLLSSKQIFNIDDVIQENQLQYLQLATDFARLAANDNQKSFKTKPFQRLLFLIRDWSYPDDEPYGFTGGHSYLFNNLKIEENQHESLISVREHIFSSFEDISCFLMPFPGKAVTRSNYDGSWLKMDEDFKDELKILIETLLHPDKLVIKKINNLELTAAELRSYIDVYFRVFQSNEIVEAQSLYEITVTEQINNLIQKAMQTYKENLIKANRLDASNFVAKLNDAHQDSKTIAINQFNNAHKMGSAKIHLKFRNELENKIEQTFSEWKVDAIQNHEKLAAEIKKTQEKEAENERLKQEQLRAYQEHQDTIKEIQRNNETYSQQQLEKYNEISRELNKVKEEKDAYQYIASQLQKFGQSIYELTVTNDLNNLVEQGLQAYKDNFAKPNHPNASNYVEKLNNAHQVAKTIAINQFIKAKKMGNDDHLLKFRNILEKKIEETFSELKN